MSGQGQWQEGWRRGDGQRGKEADGARLGWMWGRGRRGLALRCGEAGQVQDAQETEEGRVGRLAGMLQRDNRGAQARKGPAHGGD